MAAKTVRRTTLRADATKTLAKTAGSKLSSSVKGKSTKAPPVSTNDFPSPRAAAASPKESRSASPKKVAPSPRLAAGSPEESRRAPTKRSLVQRVYNTIDGELTKLEKQRGLTSQDRERASRALSQMVNALEKAVEMQREMTKRKTTGGDAKSKEALAHAEDLRREIAERLERLNRKRAPGRRSE